MQNANLLMLLHTRMADKSTASGEAGNSEGDHQVNDIQWACRSTRFHLAFTFTDCYMTGKEIETFCQQNYGVTFPMMDKVSVKGNDMCEIYKFLTQKSKNGLQDSEVEWNFQKYLINEKGELVKVIKPRTLPTDPEVINWIKS